MYLIHAQLKIWTTICDFGTYFTWGNAPFNSHADAVELAFVFIYIYKQQMNIERCVWIGMAFAICGTETVTIKTVFAMARTNVSFNVSFLDFNQYCKLKRLF